MACIVASYLLDWASRLTEAVATLGIDKPFAVQGRLDAFYKAHPYYTVVDFIGWPTSKELSDLDKRLLSEISVAKTRWHFEGTPSEKNKYYLHQRYTGNAEDTSSLTKTDAKSSPQLLTCFQDRFESVNVPLTPSHCALLKTRLAPAKMGQGTETVLDTSYRHAFTTDLSKLMISFSPRTLQWNLHQEIERKLLGKWGLEGRSVRIVPYRLNLYDKGSFFKPHKDTPLSSTHFGSLVVVVPTLHRGGDLIIRHGTKTVTVKASEGTWLSSQPAYIWAAFYSDCEHEVLQVTRGHRVTLTYHLYHTDCPEKGAGRLLQEPSVSPSPSSPSSPSPLWHNHDFVVLLLRALDDPHFLPRGGILAFPAKHRYPHTRGKWIKLGLDPFQLLKGVDKTVAALARKLGFQACIRPVYRDDDDLDLFCEAEPWFRDVGDPDKHSSDPSEDDWSESSSSIYIGRFGKFVEGGSWYEDDHSDPEIILDMMEKVEGKSLQYRRRVQWCGDPDEAYSESRCSVEFYGNSGPETNIAYTFVAILIRIPRYTSAEATPGQRSRRELVTQSYDQRFCHRSDCAQELGQGGVKKLRCGRCQQALYCSKDCQKIHWQTAGREGHRSVCRMKHVF